MDMNSPIGSNAIDANRGGLIGKPMDRVDGQPKVTGRATYAYEYADVGPRPVYGFVLEATIAKGRIATIDMAAAERAPGVLLGHDARQCAAAGAARPGKHAPSSGGSRRLLPPAGRLRGGGDIRAGFARRRGSSR